MTIIAIDPGPEQSAFIVWNGQVIMRRDTLDNGTVRLFLLDMRAGDADDERELAIEMVACYGMPVGKETFETCLWIGRFIECWQGTKKPTLVYRKDVKMHHCGNMRAKDANIRQSLIDKYGPPGTKKVPGITYGVSKHLWSAFAIATYVSETMLEIEQATPYALKG